MVWPSFFFLLFLKLLSPPWPVTVFHPALHGHAQSRLTRRVLRKIPRRSRRPWRVESARLAVRSFAPSLLPIRSPCDLSRDFYRARGVEFDSLKEVIPPMDDWCLAAAVCASRYLQKKRAKMQLISRIGTCPEGSDSTNTREQTLSWKKFFQHNFRVVAKLATPNLR